MSEKSSKIEQSVRARPRTAKQLARQERCFTLSVMHDKTVREIATELGIAQDTVIADMRYEQERRHNENAERRDFDTTRAIAFYQRASAMALERAEIALAILRQVADEPDSKSEDEGATRRSKHVSDRYLDTAIKARERIDRLLGLEAPEKAQQEMKITVEGGLPEFPHEKEAKEEPKSQV